MSQLRLRHQWLRALVVLCLAVVCACGSSGDGGGSATGPQPPAVTTATDVPEAGVLRVRISGLPPDRKGTVLVTGPNDVEHRVTSDVDIPLPAGTYVVHAGAVGDGSTKDAPAWRPALTTQEVTVDPSRGARVAVEYRPVQTRLADRARVADEAAASALTDLVTDDQGRSTLTFSAAPPSWAVGDVVVFGVTPKTPSGFFGRIVAIAGNVVTTEQAGMGDVLTEGSLVFSRELGPNDIKKITPLNGAALSFSVCQSLSAGLGKSQGVASAALTVTGELCFAPSIDLGISFSGELIPDAYFRVGADVGAGLKVEGAASIGIGVEIPIFTVTFGDYTIWTGPIPWVITPELTIVVGAEGNVTAGVTAGMHATVNAYGGFSFDAGSKRFTPFSGKTTTFTPIWPEPFATATLKGYGGPRLTLLVDRVAGPFIELLGYIQFDVDFLASPLWKLHGGVELNAGLATASFLKLSYGVNLFTYDKVIAQATDTPPIAAKTGGSRGVKTNYGSFAVAPDDTIYVTSDSSIKAMPRNGAAKWTYAGSDFMTEVVRGADGTIYAVDFSGNVYALYANGTQKWKVGPYTLAGQLSLGADGTIYLASDTKVVALSPDSGAEVWAAPKDLGGNIRGLALGKNGTIYAATTSLHALDPAAQGNVLWSTPFTGSVTGRGLAIGPDGTIFFSVYDGNGGVNIVAVSAASALKWSRFALYGDQPSSPVVGPDGTVYACSTPPGASLVALAPNGDVKWRHWHNEICKGAPAIGADGKIYIVTDRTVRAIDASNGRAAWKQDTAVGQGESSPVFLSTKDIVFGTYDDLATYYTGTTLATSGWARDGGDNFSTGRAR